MIGPASPDAGYFRSVVLADHIYKPLPMKALLTIALSTVLVASQAQPPVFPPVPGNDAERADYGLWSNPGWLLDSYGDPATDVQFVTEGASPRTYIRRDAIMSFTVTTVDTTVGGTDTLRRLDMELIGEVALRPDAIGSSARDQWRNYYLPHCGASGITGVIGYNRIVYENAYPDIDLWVFSGYYGQKMMFVVHPGGDPADIAMKFTGQNEMDVDVNGWLKLLLEDQWITLPEAVAYQYDQYSTISLLNWGASYSANNNSGIVSFNFDTYDTNKPLVFLIGPPPPFMGGPQYDELGLCWSTYLGDDGNEYAGDIRTDSDNNLYLGGRTSSTLLQFPADPGVLYATSGNMVAFLTKFSALHQLSWTLFYGGDLLTSYTRGEAVAIQETPDHRIIMAGHTDADDLWTVPNGNAYFDNTNSNSLYKGFVADVDADNGNMLWATYFGEHDVEIWGADVTPAGALVICGKAQSDLPGLQYGPPSGSMNQTYTSGADAFVAMFDPDRQLYWRSWWGGVGNDIALEIEATSNKIVLAGHTSNGGLTMVDPGGDAYTQAFGGNQDVYLIEFDPNGVVQWSTYLGGTGLDHLGPNGLDIGLLGDVFLCGQAGELDIVEGPNWYDDVSGGSNGFLARFDGSDRSPKWITYVGVGGTLLRAVEQGSDGLISITGSTQDEDFPSVPSLGMYQQSDLLEVDRGAFLIQFKPDQELLHSTWFGGDLDSYRTEGSAITTNSDGVFVFGHTHKVSDPLSYFPLDNGQGLPWFDGEYNHLAGSAQGTDGFLAWFCQEITVGVTPPCTSGRASPAIFAGADGVIVLGLEDGASTFALLDPAGRLLWSDVVRSIGGRSDLILTNTLVPGVYCLRSGSTVVLKFFVR